jgi:hypothetical protein
MLAMVSVVLLVIQITGWIVRLMVRLNYWHETP